MLKIVTYNFKRRKRAINQMQWQQLLAALSPDIVLAQETRLPSGYGQPRSFWKQMGRAYWGTAVLLPGGAIAPAQHELGGWLAGGEVTGVNTPTGKPLWVYSIHVANPPYLKTANRILDKLSEYRGDRDIDLILGGDFNLTMGVHPSGLKPTKPGTLALLARLENEFGLMNCWQTRHPTEPLAQTLRWVSNKTKNYHCDAVFVPSAWRRHLESCQVITGDQPDHWINQSDHNPVAAHFHMKQNSPNY